jgi:competence protein ComFC
MRFQTTGKMLIGALRTWADIGAGFLYPNLCQICHSMRATTQQGFVCGACRQQVRFIAPPYCSRCGLPFEGEINTTFECGNCRELELHFEWARAAVAAKGVVLEVIHRYKYNRELWFEPFLGDLLISQAAKEISSENWDVIVPIPLHRVKQRQREFNQAERLAKLLGRITKIEVANRLLKRLKSTDTQTLLSRADRAANVKAAFAVCEGEWIKDKRILLIDDVLTTGATASACAKALRDKGSGHVAVWTVARGL